MRIAMTGSSGMIGTALRKRLEAGGHEVVRVRRGNPSDPSAMWNPDDGWFREGALEGVDTVVHLAGANIGDERWSDAGKKRLVESRTDGTRLLVDHLASLSSRPSVFVSASAVGYYGSRGDETLTEESAKGTGFLADLVEAWETEALRAEESGIRTVLIRTGVVLEKDGGALKKMLPPFKMGVGGKIGSGKAWFPWIALDDIVAVYEWALMSGASGPVNAMAPNPVTNAEFTKALGKAIKRPTLLPLPPFGLKLLYGGQKTEETLLASQRALPAKLTAAGFTFTAPTIEAGLEAVLR